MYLLRCVARLPGNGDKKVQPTAESGMHQEKRMTHNRSSNLSAVSYTHLDVYKRQASYRPLTQIIVARRT